MRLVSCSESLTSRELVSLVGGLLIKIMLKMLNKKIIYFLRRRRIWKSDDEASSGDSQRRAEGKNEDKNQKTT